MNYGDFIVGFDWEDKQLCDDLITYFNTDIPVKWEGTQYASDQVGIDKTKRYAIETALDDNDALMKRYMENLQISVEQYTKKYTFANEYAGFRNSQITKIQYYPLGCSYGQWHCERTSAEHPVSSRHLVFMTYLNDVTDDGETEFYYQQVKVQPKRGLTLIWPADWTHTHRGIPSMTQEKYIVTGWLNYA